MQARTVPSSRHAAFPSWAGLPPAATYVRSITNMSPDERIQQSVATALAAFRARVDEDLKALVQQLVTSAATERDQALAAVMTAAKAEAERDIKQKVADVEARAQATIDQKLAEAEARAKSAIELVETARSKERDLAESDVKALEAKAEEKLQAALASSREELKLALTNAENRANATVKENIATAHVQEREAEMAGLSRLLESIRGLDGASSLSEVLDALGQAVGREAARAAVLVLRNDRLLGWKLSGFGARDAQPKLIDVGLTEAGVIGLAVGSARVATSRDSQSAGAGPGFAQLPADRMGLAVPLIVGGRVVAAVYADGVAEDGREQVVPSSWPEVIEILARHASRCLEALSVQKAASTTPSPRFWVPPTKGAPQQTSEAPAASASPHPTPEAKAQERNRTEAFVQTRADAEASEGPEESARCCARLLLLDIKLNHEPAVDEGGRSRNLLSRLRPEIERARRIYEECVPASLRTRAELFHQELLATLCGGDPARLGFQT